MLRPALAVAAFAALGAAVASAQTFEMPLRKAGLWEIVVKAGGSMPSMTMHQCTDAATDKAMSTMFGSPQQTCSEQKSQRTGDTIVVDSVCTIGGVKSTTHAVIKGDFNAAYTVDVTSKREGGGSAMMAPAGDGKVAMEAKWTGACKSDQKPGDMIMPGGMKMNIADMQKMRQGGGGMMPPPKGMTPGGGMMAPPK
jgi:Protein of unknown function (DUF3617)